MPPRTAWIFDDEICFSLDMNFPLVIPIVRSFMSAQSSGPWKFAGDGGGR